MGTHDSASRPPGGQRVGVLMGGRGLGPPALFPHLAGFERRFRELGYVLDDDGRGTDPRGRPVCLDYHWAEPWDDAAVAAEAAGLVEAGCSVIVTSGTTLTLAVKRQTTTIPIVMICDDGDCVGAGVVASLERTGCNVTGSTSAIARLSGIRLELLREAVPGIARVGVVYNPTVPDKVSDLAELDSAARRLAVELLHVELRHPDEIPGAFDAMAEAGADGLIVLSDAVVFRRHKQIADLAAERALPAIYPHRAWVVRGGLMAYGPNMGILYERAADFVEQILRGAQARDLPILEPDGFEFTLNATTAEALGLTLPPALLAKVDSWLP
jgi:putative tryptophan/tyrosine transport system substrate-binding protein